MITRRHWVLLLGLLGGSATPTVLAVPPIQVEHDQLLALLKGRHFEKLEQTLNTALRDYESDSLHAHGISQGFAAFYRPNEALQAMLDDWVQRMPQSANARLARSMYMRSLGWKKRGTQHWRQIPAASRADMDPLFLQAVRDARAALGINPKLMPGYFILIDIAKVYGERKTVHGLFQDAMRIDSSYYDVRDAYLTALEPKWGGSEAAMAAFIEDTRRYYQRNPALKKLEIKLLQMQGEGHFRAKRYSQAVTELSKAIDIDPNTHAARQYRGLAYQMLGRYDQASSDYRYSAERGVANAKYQLGWLYLYGLGVPRDHQLSARWLSEAATEVAAAQSAYAALLWEGGAVPQDKVRAKTLWRAAAARGNDYAKKSLARTLGKH